MKTSKRREKISLDSILEKFTSHLGYEKYQESKNSNYGNGYNKKSLFYSPWEIISSLRFVSFKGKKEIFRNLKTIYITKTEKDVQLLLIEFNDIWSKKISSYFTILVK